MFKTWKIIYLSISIIAILTFAANKVFAFSHSWIKVPPSDFGYQVWDKNSLRRNSDGSLRVLSKFVPIAKNEITKEIFYTMDIDCIEKSFKDIAVGSNELNLKENIDANWQNPNGDPLIIGVINQVCHRNEYS